MQRLSLQKMGIEDDDFVTSHVDIDIRQSMSQGGATFSNQPPQSNMENQFSAFKILRYFRRNWKAQMISSEVKTQARDYYNLDAIDDVIAKVINQAIYITTFFDYLVKEIHVEEKRTLQAQFQADIDELTNDFNAKVDLHQKMLATLRRPDFSDRWL